MYFEFQTYKTSIRVEKRVLGTRVDVPGFKLYGQTQESYFFPTTENWNLKFCSTDRMPFSLEKVVFFFSKSDK